MHINRKTEGMLHQSSRIISRKKVGFFLDFRSDPDLESDRIHYFTSVSVVGACKEDF